MFPQRPKSTESRTGPAAAVVKREQTEVTAVKEADMIVPLKSKKAKR